jgi:hypothetical protein
VSASTVGITPEWIDGSFVPRARADVAMLVLDDGVVLGRLEPGATFMTTCALNPTGSLIWRCFDGSGSITEIARDIADVYERDSDAVIRDVRDFARDVGAAGLLDGVAVPVIEIGVEQTALAEGARFPTFTALTSDGTRWSSAELRGARALVVNWSATCRYCTSIADDLAGLVPALSRAGVALVRLAADDCDAFAGLGTPVAYAVDRAGRVEAPAALGARAVVALARALGRSRS